MTLNLLTKTLVVSAGLVCAGCAHDATRDAIRDALATENPARADAAAGPPPVRAEALAIVPTGLPPTEAPAIAPQPILPGMDEAFSKRRLPAGVQPGPVATQPADLEKDRAGRAPQSRPAEKFEDRVH